MAKFIDSTRHDSLGAGDALEADRHDRPKKQDERSRTNLSWTANLLPTNWSSSNDDNVDDDDGGVHDDGGDEIDCALLQLGDWILFP